MPDPLAPALAPAPGYEPVAGENHYRALLTNAQVRQLRQAYAGGEATAVLAGRYGVSAPRIVEIAGGRRYKAAGGPITHRKPRTCDDWTALWIRVTAADLADEELAEEFGISRDMVKRIRYGISYGWLDEVLPKVKGQRRG